MRRVRWSMVLAALGIFACDDPADPEPVTGSLQLSIGGLPDTINATITLTGPGGFSAQVSRPQMFARLIPGTYTIAASQVVTGIATFVPAFESQTITVGASAVSQATVIYSVTTGSITIRVLGVPPDIQWTVMVTGPDGYRDSVSTNKTLGNLRPGIYFVSATELRKGLNVYAPGSAEFAVTVTASATPSGANVGYTLITGTLAIHLNGLPSGVNGDVIITGPLGFVAAHAGDVTLEGLRQGRYEISAAPVGSGSGQRAPTPAKQNLVVIAGSTAVVSVNYWPVSSPPGLNLGIDALQLQQVVQTYGGAVPAIAGRDALLRVFVRASEPNVAAPAVRVRLFDGIQLLASYNVPSPKQGVPTVIDEGDLAASWNLPLPGGMIRPGLRILADADPDNVIAETDEGDNAWPSSGSPLGMDVRVAPPLTVRLVPVTQSSTGLTGNVTAANVAQYEAAARQLLPVMTLTAEVRSPYTTTAPPLQPNDANGAWVQVLSELNALRAAEGSTAHYYGVVRVPYTAGVVGISYLPSFAAVGFDSMPKATATFVHELGHHFGRLHSPSCGAGGYDANYPYMGGGIGVYGFDFATGTLRPPSTPDIMGYCDGRWISDYSFAGILGYRASQPASAAVAVAAQRGLLVWGRIGPKGPVLEPAFEVFALPKLPTVSGAHRLEIAGENGRLLTAFSFTAERPVDSPAATDESFAFVVPYDSFGGREPAEIRLLEGARRAVLRAPSRPPGASLEGILAPAVTRLTPSSVRLVWTDAPGRGVLVRNAQTGEILTFARGGVAVFKSDSRELDLTLSDGVRSSRRVAIVR